MVYCTLTLRIIRSVYINHFETTTNPDYMRGHNQKKDTHTLDFDVTLVSQHIPLTPDLSYVIVNAIDFCFRHSSGFICE